jgi:hypothetical protein
MVQGNAAAALTFLSRQANTFPGVVSLKRPGPPLDSAGWDLPRRTTRPSGKQWPHEIKHDSPAGAASDPPDLELGEVEDVVDQREQVTARAEHAVEELNVSF